MWTGLSGYGRENIAAVDESYQALSTNGFRILNRLDLIWRKALPMVTGSLDVSGRMYPLTAESCTSGISILPHGQVSRFTITKQDG